jgi:hypothetical protein
MFVPMFFDQQIYVGHVRPGAWFKLSIIRGFKSPGDYTTEVSRGVGPPLILSPLGCDLCEVNMSLFPRFMGPLWGTYSSSGSRPFGKLCGLETCIAPGLRC